MALDPRDPDPQAARAVGQQRDAGRAGGDAGDPANQATRGEDGGAGAYPLQAALTQLQLLPPTGGLAGDHRSRDPCTLGLIQGNQTPQAGVVALQLLQPRLLIQLLRRTEPFGLGLARPERTSQEGVGIEDARTLAEPHASQDGQQQPPRPGLKQLLKQWNPEESTGHYAFSLLKSGVSSTRSRRW